MLLIIGFLVLAICQHTKTNSKQVVQSEDFLIVSPSAYYFDKTGLIAKIIYDSSNQILITRPSGWGKTLNLSMLKYFFTNAPDSNGNPQVPNPYLNYFQGGPCSSIDGQQMCVPLRISQLQNWEEVQKFHQGKYPVILLKLKELQIDTYKQFLESLKQIILEVYQQFKYIIQDKYLTDHYQDYFNKLSNREQFETNLLFSVLRITRLAFKFHKRRVILLIDDYDELFIMIARQALNNNNIISQEQHSIMKFYNSFLGASIKSNDSLQRCVLTGIFDSIEKQAGSGFNSVRINTILSKWYQQFYGLQLQEIKEKLELIETSNQNKQYMLGNITQWYDGYENPYGNKLYPTLSVIKYINKFIEFKQLEPQNYWVRTGPLCLIDYIRNIQYSDIYDILQDIISGKQIVVRSQYIINYYDILSYQSISFSSLHLEYILIHYGYLTCTGNDEQKLICYLPNEEVKTQLKYEFDLLLKDVSISKENRLVQEIKTYINNIKPQQQIYQAILENNIEQISQIFTQHPNLDCNRYDEMNLLSLAAIQGNDSVIASIIDNCHYSETQLVPIDQSGLSVQVYAFYGQASAETIEQLTKISAQKVDPSVLTIWDLIFCKEETITLAQYYYPKQFSNRFIYINDYVSYYLIGFAKSLINIYQQDSICAHLQHNDAIRRIIQRFQIMVYNHLSLVPCTTSTINTLRFPLFKQDKNTRLALYMCVDNQRQLTYLQHQYNLFIILVNISIGILVVQVFLKQYILNIYNYIRQPRIQADLQLREQQNQGQQNKQGNKDTKKQR